MGIIKVRLRVRLSIDMLNLMIMKYGMIDYIQYMNLKI